MRRAAVSGPDGAVAAQHWRAAEAGAEMLRANGTAADAAVATAFAVGVCEPWMSGLGGTGLAVIWEAGEEAAQTVDFLGVLPSGIDPADYPVDPEGAKNLMGYPGGAGPAQSRWCHRRRRARVRCAAWPRSMPATDGCPGRKCLRLQFASPGKASRSTGMRV